MFASRALSLRFAPLGVLIVLAAACGGPQYAFAGSPRVESSDGLVEVEEIEGGQRLVSLSIRHLPGAPSLGPELTTYVVWARVGDAESAVRLGELAYDEETREGTFVGTVSGEVFTLVITAEASATADAPSDVVVADRLIGED